MNYGIKEYKGKTFFTWTSYHAQKVNHPRELLPLGFEAIDGDRTPIRSIEGPPASHMLVFAVEVKEVDIFKCRICGEKYNDSQSSDEDVSICKSCFDYDEEY